MDVSGLKDKVFADKKIEEIRELSKIVEREERETFNYVAKVILKS